MKFYDFDATIHIRANDIEADSLEEAVLEAIENGDFEIVGKEVNHFDCCDDDEG